MKKMVYNCLKNVSSTKLFNFSTVPLKFGFAFIGLGLLFENGWIGIILGFGLALVIVSIIAYNVLKYILIYNKEKL